MVGFPHQAGQYPYILYFYRATTKVTTGDDMTGYDTGGSTGISGSKIVYLKHSDLAYGLRQFIYTM